MAVILSLDEKCTTNRQFLMSGQTRRLRDPVHDLIVFDGDDAVDMTAWRLINTPEFQRLRRIRQLGVSEYVFPGATHTRFAHSIGVYHNARRLLGVLEKKLGSQYDHFEAKVARLAALLHDVGHGPFSHAFEKARETLASSRTGDDEIEEHEVFSSRLIEAEDSRIRKILAENGEDSERDLAGRIGALLRADDPASIYHAVVSSSFDADRLDYLARDRLMTGTSAGAIDVEWLMDNIEIFDVPVGEEEGRPGVESDVDVRVPTFIFKEKARPAAEDFLLARYRLYTTVYLHKTTRGFEKVISALIRWLGGEDNAAQIGIESDHPLVAFLAPEGGCLSEYRQLDDLMVWGLIDRIARMEAGYPGDLCRRLLDRRPLRYIDLAREFGDAQQMVDDTAKRLRDEFSDRLNRTVFEDDAGISLYSQMDGEDTRPHKRIRVRSSQDVREITRFDDTIIGSRLRSKRPLPRFYFLDEADYHTARRIREGR